MAFRHAIRQGFPRRVVNYYLLFCLITIAWLTVSAVFVARSAIQASAESTSLSRFSRAATRCEMEYVRHGMKQMQSRVESIARENGFLYCALVVQDGSYAVHSDARQVGRARPKVRGSVETLGSVECVRYFQPGEGARRRYSIPLQAGNDPFGTLEIAIPEPNTIGMILAKADLVPVALLGPLFFVAVGAVILQRVTRPLSEIETRLRQIAVAPAVEVEADYLKDVAVRNIASVGWNRVVQLCRETVVSGDLQQRLDQAIAQRCDTQFDQLLNSIPEGLAATDVGGHITFANQSFNALLGRGRDEDPAHDVPVETCLELADADPESPLLQPELAGRNVVTELQRSSGVDDRILRIARFPVRPNGAETATGYVWSIRDITQQKLAEKTRDEFLDSATHELRTPLANIKAYAETLVLSEMLDVEQQKEFCNTINAEATRLARLIDDLLSVASMEAGALVISRENVELDRLLQEIVGKVAAQIEQHHITFEAIFSPKLPELALDKDKLATALVNLLSNAIKYTPDGGRVALKAHVTDDNVVIEVEDSGIGIAEEELPKVFNRFFRSDDHRVQNTTGTGLGLALTHEVVKLHGGTLSVQSVLNEGSTFTVTLPMGH